MRVSESQDFGAVTMRIEGVLKEKGISKNQICKDLDLPRGNFNRYCRNDFQRIDAALLCKLCWYLDVEMSELLIYHRPEPKK